MGKGGQGWARVGKAGEGWARVGKDGENLERLGKVSAKLKKRNFDQRYMESRDAEVTWSCRWRLT